MKGVIWFTGLSGAGKTTIGEIVVGWLEKNGQPVEYLDGDRLRQTTSARFGFSEQDRKTHLYLVAAEAGRLSATGALVVVSTISPYEESRVTARQIIEPVAPFYEVYVATPLDVCLERDPKGLYVKAMSGEIENFTGISAPYEEPTDPDLMLDTTLLTAHECAERVLALLGYTYPLPA